jgi:hypothetical protein
MTAVRSLTLRGVRWSAAPSGFVTQYVGDECGVIFTRLDAGVAEVRFSRFSPMGIRSREAAFLALSDAALARLLEASQQSVRAPEGGYRT